MKAQTGFTNLLNEVAASVEGLTNLVCRIFDRLPLEEQPRYLAGWPCGDGFWLRAMFEAIRSRSRRGRALENYPLRLIGIDSDGQALQAAAQHLADLPLLLIRADSKDSLYLLSELSRAGIRDPEQILFFRTVPESGPRSGELEKDGFESRLHPTGRPCSGVQTAPEPDYRSARKLFDSSGEQLSEASVLLMSAAGVGFFPEVSRPAGILRRWAPPK